MHRFSPVQHLLPTVKLSHLECLGRMPHINCVQGEPCFVAPAWVSIAAKCLRAMLNLFSPNLIDQSSCRILITHAKARPILHDDWSVRFGENRSERALKHLAAMLHGFRLYLYLNYGRDRGKNLASYLKGKISIAVT